MWLWPYGYDYNALPDNWQEVKKLAEDAADALYQVHGTVFDPINSADLCKLFACFLKYLKQGGSITWLLWSIQ